MVQVVKQRNVYSKPYGEEHRGEQNVKIAQLFNPMELLDVMIAANIRVKRVELTVPKLFQNTVVFRSTIFLARCSVREILKGATGSGSEKRTVTETSSVESMVINVTLINFLPDSVGNCNVLVI